MLFTYPLDVIRARLAFQVAGDELYQGIMHAFYTMFKTEGGIKAFYKGIVPTMLGMTPYAGKLNVFLVVFCDEITTWKIPWLGRNRALFVCEIKHLYMVAFHKSHL